MGSYGRGTPSTFFGKALSLYQEALAFAERVLPPGHPKLAVAEKNVNLVRGLIVVAIVLLVLGVGGTFGYFGRVSCSTFDSIEQAVRGKLLCGFFLSFGLLLFAALWFTLNDSPEDNDSIN